MFGIMYLMAVLLGLIVGLHILEDSVGRAEREGLTFRFRKISVSLGPVLIMLIIVFVLDITYGSYIGSFRFFLWLTVIMLLAGLIHGMIALKDQNIMGHIRICATILLVTFLLVSGFARFIAPSNLRDNELYDSLSNNVVTDENPNFVDDAQDIRVVSWELATNYLERAYGDSGSFLATDGESLMQYTDPSYLNGSFVWVNAPKYEFLKWTNDKKVPFFVYIINDPSNMTSGNVNDLTNKIDVEFDVHKTKISWQNRLEQILFDKYAGKYEISQIRFDVDDNEDPWWIVYLARRDTWYSVHYLEKILLVNAQDIDDTYEYDVSSQDIPEWLEVVYPDEYVYQWVSFWGSNRMGLGYRWFDKGHLYNPDDSSARFIVVNDTTYWQIPMVQKSSRVLGGYVWVNTRTGEATFYNREKQSLVDKDTVEEQIKKYLASGALGFQQLDIHEGYLYPFKMDDGHVREAYVFPLYAGYTVAKYAIVDAIDYTSEPVVDADLDAAMDKYQSKTKESPYTQEWTWEEYSVMSYTLFGDIDHTMILLVRNDTGVNLSLYVTEPLLEADGNLTSIWEWEELSLAISRWDRGDEVNLWMVITPRSMKNMDGTVVDIDWEGSSIVER